MNSPDLDIEVATKLLSYRWLRYRTPEHKTVRDLVPFQTVERLRRQGWTDPLGDEEEVIAQVPAYSSEISDAYVVLGLAVARRCRFICEYDLQEYCCTIIVPPFSSRISATSASLPEAICKAALLALG